MKIFKSIILSVVGLTAFTSCNDWLDVNTNPNTPTAESATIQTRLAHCEFYLNSANGFAGMRTYMGMGDMTMNSRTSTYGCMAQWQPLESMVTTPYQWFFVGCGSNLQDLYDKAMAQGAYHYAGASRLMYAYGFMLMTDLYGEMPYTEGLGESATPTYDNGKTIYIGCLNKIDEAIELLSKAQDGGPALSADDSWNQGDVNKWLKMAYLFKARWINKLIKKGEGSYKEGKYDPDEILSCLEKAHQSNADNTVFNHTDANGTTHDVLGWNEPVDYNPLYSVLGMNSNYYVTKMFTDNLTNFDGKGIEDPRADHLIPWAISEKTTGVNYDELGVKWNGNWRRSIGVDMHTLIRTSGAPYSTSFNAEKNWYCGSEDPARLGDTIYIQTTCGSKGYGSFPDLCYRKLKGNDRSRQSGIFSARPSSPTFIASYHEACFIKAEVLFRKGNKTDAFTAYKEGIKASIDAMNDKLSTWLKEDANLANCPSFALMSTEAIDNYLNNAIGNVGDLTLAKIMTQKRLAMPFTVEVFNDMRRYDYDSNVFLNWEIPAEYSINTDAQRAIPMGKQFRRWRQCSHEYKYNSVNLIAIGAQVPGANTSADNWNMEPDAWSINVWWDSDQE